MSMKHPLAHLSLTAALYCAASPFVAIAATAEKFQQAQDMRYGESLYHYFQGNNFDALSVLMVAEKRNGEKRNGENLDGIQHHADNAALIEGGISLAFGLESRAALLFEQQLQKNDSDITDKREKIGLARYRALAWQKLAELNYRHQNWPLSREQLQKSGAAKQTDLALNLALRTHDLQGAQRLADESALPIEKRVLGQLNLAAAFAREQQFAQAITHYQNASALVQVIELASPELLILQDKAHMGAGYAYALQQEYAQAAAEFRQVRLRTAWADKALLGMGWASINSGEYQEAINALQFLITQSPLSPEVQEALVALPYSYEKLARPKAALLAYQQAENQYGAALAELHNLQQEIPTLEFSNDHKNESLNESLAEDEIRWRYGWLQAAEAPAPLRENLRYLRRLLQSDQFQLRLTDLRDLRQLDRVLEQWQTQVPLFNQLIDERGERRKAIVENYQSAQFDQQVDIAQQQYRNLDTALARIEQDRDGLALLQGEAGELLTLVTDAEKRYADLNASGKTRPQQRETLQRARAILLWQASQDYHDNLWQQRKTLRELESDLHRAATQRQQAEDIAARAPQLNNLQQRVHTADSRLHSQQRAINAAAQSIEASIKRDVLLQLQREQQRIAGYIAHTQLAIARLYDALRDDAVDNALESAARSQDTVPLQDTVAEVQP
jgi:hypothetical protein